MEPQTLDELIKKYRTNKSREAYTSSKASSTEARPTESIAYQNFGTIIPGAA